MEASSVAHGICAEQTNISGKQSRMTHPAWCKLRTMPSHALAKLIPDMSLTAGVAAPLFVEVTATVRRSCS
jgi:hypothetical protein